jgi:nicotinamidase-related amidase
MSELELPVRRAALLLIELQNDIVHEDNIGTRGFRGVLAAQVQKRGVLAKVQSLVRASVNRGFEMFVIEDCCAGFPDAWHDFSVTNILPLLSTVTSCAAVLAALEAAPA